MLSTYLRGFQSLSKKEKSCAVKLFCHLSHGLMPFFPQLLLKLARNLFGEQNKLESLVTNIIKEARSNLKCERCTIYLLDLKMYDEVRI